MDNKVELDLRGRICPEPYIIAMRGFSKLKEGETMVVLMDSWRCVIMFLQAIEATGLGKVNVEKLPNGVYKLNLIRSSS